VLFLAGGYLAMAATDARFKIRPSTGRRPPKGQRIRLTALRRGLFDSIGVRNLKRSFLRPSGRGKTYSSYQFVTHPFCLLHRRLHGVCKIRGTNKNVKIIPHNIAELLTPIALAYWLSGGRGSLLDFTSKRKAG